MAAPGMTCDVNSDCAPLATTDYSSLPPDVLHDAQALAQQYYGYDQAKASEMVSQLAATYLAVKDADAAIVFNPGAGVRGLHVPDTRLDEHPVWVSRARWRRAGTRWRSWTISAPRTASTAW